MQAGGQFYAFRVHCFSTASLVPGYGWAIVDRCTAQRDGWDAETLETIRTGSANVPDRIGCRVIRTEPAFPARCSFLSFPGARVSIYSQILLQRKTCSLLRVFRTNHQNGVFYTSFHPKAPYQIERVDDVVFGSGFS